MQQEQPLKKARALISVSDKTNLIEIASFLHGQGLEILSTGGTRKYLLENEIPVLDVSEYTGFPEVLDGRVKTLHPHVHMALLATKKVEHQKSLEKYQLLPIEVLVCNLYPFEQSFQSVEQSEKTSTTGSGSGYSSDLIEDIDIGGVTLIRAAAKNFHQVTTLCHPEDYKTFIEKKGQFSIDDRAYFAQKAFSHTAHYDSVIAESFAQFSKKPASEFGLPLKKHQELRYGENPHQKATWYKGPSTEGLHQAKQLQGKELSYNNLLDLNACCDLVMKLDDPGCVAVKHNNPCGVAEGVNIDAAVAKALAADPVSVFGGIIALNRPLEKAAAEKLSEVFLECIIAPAITSEAKEVLQKKKNLRVLIWPNLAQGQRLNRSKYEVKSLFGGFLVQEVDALFPNALGWKFVSEKPSDSLLRDLILAEKIASQLKSNSIAIVDQGTSVGLGMGQVNRIDAVHHAISRMQKFHGKMTEPVLASDAFFPFADSIETIAKAGIRWVLQPGGSIKDEEVIAAAKEKNVNLVLTGVRHFRH